MPPLDSKCLRRFSVEVVVAAPPALFGRTDISTAADTIDLSFLPDKFGWTFTEADDDDDGPFIRVLCLAVNLAFNSELIAFDELNGLVVDIDVGGGGGNDVGGGNGGDAANAVGDEQIDEGESRGVSGRLDRDSL